MTARWTSRMKGKYSPKIEYCVFRKRDGMDRCVSPAATTYVGFVKNHHFGPVGYPDRNKLFIPSPAVCPRWEDDGTVLSPS